MGLSLLSKYGWCKNYKFIAVSLRTMSQMMMVTRKGGSLMACCLSLNLLMTWLQTTRT